MHLCIIYSLIGYVVKGGHNSDIAHVVMFSRHRDTRLKYKRFFLQVYVNDMVTDCSVYSRLMRKKWVLIP